MKPHMAEMYKGPQAFENFKNATKAVIATPPSVIRKRIEEHGEQAGANPNRRGPKRKVKTVSPALSAPTLPEKDARS